MNTTFIREVGVFRWAVRYGYLQFRKRALKANTRIVLPTGASMLLPRHSQYATEVFVTGANTDWGAEAIFARFADQERDFLDVGAHIGYYSVYLSPRVRRVYAFEPDQRNLPSLRANAELARNVDIFAVAVSSTDGNATLHLGSSPAVNSLEGGRTGNDINVPITTIDSFTASRPGIDVALIKTDIEGHDINALYGMQQTVARDQPLILTECQDHVNLPRVCQEWRYSVFGFIQDHQSTRRRFRRIAAEDLPFLHYKMLFLVPARLDEAFARIQDE